MHLTPTEIEALWLSLIVALWCVVICVPIAGLLGWVLARREFPGKAVLDVAVHLPLVLPPVATGYLLLLALGRQGWIGASLDNWFGLTFAFQWTGAVIASTVMALPLAVRAIRLALEAVPQELEISAASLGASRSQILWHVTLPLCLPGFAAAAILAFARSLGEFGATITFVSNIPGETQTIPNALYAVLQTPGGDAPAMRLMLISLGLAFAALLVSELLARRVRYHVGRAPRSGWSL
ncbi:MAG TPA: molybdate ABC transporter permease subunit [Alphaproteobacteria bacterium]|nr:molybdate ABC transporter permease subunit [Alphaproteobacteria bacterium]HAJ48172.1 molybdate ABC transporter permease subunit [Alphaproteobacteria bacterium]